MLAWIIQLKALNSSHELSSSKCGCKVHSAQVHLDSRDDTVRRGRMCRQHCHYDVSHRTTEIKSNKV